MAPSQVPICHDVPGTIHLLHGTGDPTAAGGQLVLQPRPSSDPEDPLNWTRRRKLLAIGMVYLYVFGIGIAACVQYSVLTKISEGTGIQVSELNLGTGLMFLFLGWGCLIWQPLALTYGRRGWYVHRSLLGLLAAPVESLPEVSVPDLFFAHERGNYMGIYAFVLFGSNYLAPFFAGFINDSADWRWTMHFGSLVLAACAVLMFFFMEETIYFRDDIEREHVDEQKPTATIHEQQSGTASPSAGRSLPPKSYASGLKLFRLCDKRPTPKQAVLKSWRAIAIFAFFPTIAWAGLLYGTNLAWYNVLNATISRLLGAHPYNFSPKLIGVAYLSPFTFGAIGAVWSGHISDLTMIWLVRRNSGIREPEQRLWALAISGLLCSAGLVLWGVGASKGIHFIGLIIGFGFVALGIVCAGSIALAYAVDCFKEIAGESMITIIIIRNTIGFAFNYAIDPWINTIGLQSCFISAAFISLMCTGSFILMIIFGKKLRRLSARKYWEYVAEDLDV
ncbi:hypothetical protein DL766_010232 [Monosporascus sp. MC13-8B]|nr:hypothetical protein DL763_003806 [Monosporascus cannonballus]RYP02733.1 hypothetical protein DL766_010232 [Monosporascus sp. MC13-8B]